MLNWLCPKEKKNELMKVCSQHHIMFYAKFELEQTNIPAASNLM